MPGTGQRINKDIPALKMLLGAELIYVDFRRNADGQDRLPGKCGSGDAASERIASGSMKVHLYGTVAVVNRVYRENGRKNGEPYMLPERFTDTWARRNDRWICVASHSTLTSSQENLLRLTSHR